MNKNDLSSRHFQRKISQFCELRIAPISYRRVLEKIHPLLVSLIIYRESPPLLNGHIDWTAITQACGIEADLTAELKKRLQPGLDAIIRWLGATPAAEADSWPGQNGVRPEQPPRLQPESLNVRRPMASLPRLNRCHVGRLQNRSALSLKHYSKRQKIPRAFRKHLSIICVGSATPIGSSIAT